MPTTLKGFAEEQRDRLKQKKIETQQAFVAAQEALADALKRHGELSQAFSKVEKEIAELRRKLPSGPMPDDSAELVAEWRDLIIQHRIKRRELLDADGILDQAEKALTRIESEHVRTSGQLTAAEATLKEEEAREKRKSELKAKLTEEPLSTLRIKAEAVMAVTEGGDEPEAPEEPEVPEEPEAPEEPGAPEEPEPPEEPEAPEEPEPPEEPEVPEEPEAPEEPEEPTEPDPDQKAFLEAKARVEGDIPENLRKRAVERGEGEAGRLVITRAAAVDAENKLNEHREKMEGPSGKVVRQQVLYQGAEASFSDYVIRAKERYDLAITLLKGIRSGAELTPAERERINDAELVASAEPAIIKEKARDEARDAVVAKKAELAQKKLELLAENIDTDVDQNGDVQAMEAALNQLTTALETAETAFTEEMRQNLDTWEASVPDPIWANLASFETAKKILTGLKDTNPNDLADAMDNAEEELTAATAEAAKSARTLEYLQSEAGRKRERLTFAEDALNQHVLSALRGDN